MVWLIIVGVFLLALGPILMAMPSARDRRLAALRAQARQLGIAVQLTELPHPAPTAEQQVSAGGARRSPVLACAAYRLPVARAAAQADSRAVSSAADEEGGESTPTFAARTGAVGWRLQRRAGAQLPNLPAGWEWFPAGSTVSPKSIEIKVVDLLNGLPEDLLAVEGARGSVALYWTEDGAVGRLQQVFALLQQLRELMQRTAPSS